ncbi:MAG: hypothetical protein R2848_01945 [Thermomicrobiales bacterium]
MTTEQDGIVAITDPHIDPLGTLNDAFWIPMTLDASAGPLAGAVNLTTEFRTMNAGVQLQDVYALLRFVTPPQLPMGGWSVGFGFWADSAGNYYDPLRARRGRHCDLESGSGNGHRHVSGAAIGHALARAVDLTPGAENDLTLVVYQGVARDPERQRDWRRCGGELPAAPVAGDVFAEVEFQAANPAETATLPMSVSEFSVWDMSGGEVFGCVLPALWQRCPPAH